MSKVKDKDKYELPPILDVYYEELSKITLLDKDRERKLLLEFKSDGITDKRKAKITELVIESNLRLVFALANSFSKRDPDKLPELISAGNEGLLIALKKFNPVYNVRFCTYAGHWVSMSMRKVVGSSLIKTPSGKPIPIYEDEISLTNLSEVPDYESDIQKVQTKVVMETWTRFLSDRERYILTNTAAKCSLRDMATALDLSSERVRQLKTSANNKLSLWLTYHFPESQGHSRELHLGEDFDPSDPESTV
jgi:RNA polymerase sigma factor (sigma-70 family)